MLPCSATSLRRSAAFRATSSESAAKGARREFVWSRALLSARHLFLLCACGPRAAGTSALPPSRSILDPRCSENQYALRSRKSCRTRLRARCSPEVTRRKCGTNGQRPREARLRPAPGVSASCPPGRATRTSRARGFRHACTLLSAALHHLYKLVSASTARWHTLTAVARDCSAPVHVAMRIAWRIPPHAYS